MDLLTQKHRTFERYEPSRTAGLGECHGPQQKGPGARRQFAAPQTAESRVIVGRQSHAATPTAADALAATYVDQMDRRTRTARRASGNSLGQCRGKCHAPNSGRAREPLASFRDAQPVSSGQSNGNAMPPGLAAQIERMERVKQVRGPKAPPYDSSQQTFQALQISGKGLAHVRIVEWLGQDFKAYATPWEQRFSSLTHSGRRIYSGRYVVAIPIVDQRFTVVGHVITVNATWCWVLKEDFMGSSTAVSPYLNEGKPVFVDDRPKDRWCRVGTSDNRKTVLVAIDGEVLQLQSSSDKASAVVYDGWMLDVLQLGGGVITNLGRAAIKRSVKAIHRRTSGRKVTQLTGRTNAAAKQARARRAARATPKPKPRIGNSVFIKETGMPRDHFHTMRQTASDQNVMAMVRNTNTASTPKIALGCEAKPLPIKANTDEFGVVNVGMNKAHARAAVKHGYYIVDADGVARRTVVGPGKVEIEELKLDGAFWPVRPGQLVTTGPPGPPVQPLVGDYDLMDVFPMDSMGTNVALHSIGGKTAKDITGPYVTKFAAVANARFDRIRIMHGAQGQFGGFRGGVTVFFPNGNVLLLRTEVDVRKFYESIRRQTAKGTYNPNVGSAAHQAAREEGIEAGKIIDMAAWKRQQSGIVDDQ